MNALISCRGQRPLGRAIVPHGMKRTAHIGWLCRCTSVLPSSIACCATWLRTVATGPYSSESCNMTRSIMCRSTSCACVRVRASRACPRKGACARWRASRGRVRESSRARARGTGVRRTMACRGRQAMAQRGTQRTPHAWHTPDGIHRRVSTWHTVHTMRHEVGGEGKPARRARA